MTDEEKEKFERLQEQLDEERRKNDEKENLIEDQAKRITREGVRRLQVERRAKDVARPRSNGKYGDEFNEGDDFIVD